MGTYVLHEHLFACQAGKYPFSGEASRVGIDQRILGRSAHFAVLSVLGSSSSRNQAGALRQRSMT